MLGHRLRSPTFVAVSAALLAALVGGTVLVRVDIADRREAFRVEARAAHRLLGQQAARNDAILAMLALSPLDDPAAALARDEALVSLFPQLLAVQQWRQGKAEGEGSGGGGVVGGVVGEVSGALTKPASASIPLDGVGPGGQLTDFDVNTGRYRLVAGGSTRDEGRALQIDGRRLLSTSAWPMRPGDPVEVRLGLGPASLVLQVAPAEGLRPFGLTDGFVFEEAIDSASQPLVLSIRQATGPSTWPWRQLVAWTLASGLVAAAGLALVRARQARHRSEDLARLARVARLESLGELAAGMAHELNQPLAAILASTQAALRVLPAAEPLASALLASEQPASERPASERPASELAASDSSTVESRGLRPADIDPADAALAREAVALAAAQARRASDVLRRLRAMVEPQRGDRSPGAVRLDRLAAGLLAMMAPEFKRDGVVVRVQGRAAPALADPVAVEQILHNLIANAVQAMAGSDRRIDIVLAERGLDTVTVAVRDNGPGIEAAVLPRLFEPFFTTRADGLGLGLALCESLARSQGGSLEVTARRPGAAFVLSLPRWRPDPPRGDSPS